MNPTYSTREVARLVKLSERRIRDYVRIGIIGQRTSNGESEAGNRTHRFDFRDLSVLKTARRLLESGVSAAQVEQTLVALREQVPEGVPLSAVHLFIDGSDVVASDGSRVWVPATGQQRLRFDGEGAALLQATPSAPKEQKSSAHPRLAAMLAGPGDMSAADYWFDTALQLEENDPDGAYEAYLRALACNPEHVEATINIGRMCSGGGDLKRAAAYFRLAIRIDPTHPVAHFNLAVTLHDMQDHEGALAAYRAALIHDPHFADAHFNLAALLEQLGQREQALAHLQAYDAARSQDAGPR